MSEETIVVRTPWYLWLIIGILCLGIWTFLVFNLGLSEGLRFQQSRLSIDTLNGTVFTDKTTKNEKN